MQTPQTHAGVVPVEFPAVDRTALEEQVRELGEWFHNIDLLGVATAPHHFLGDFPGLKWRRIATAIPEDLTGATVLDIGCNGGFYSIQMKQRGAERVLGVDVDDRYLSQARFAAHTLGLDIEFEKRSVYDVDKLAGQFDYVIFMGLFYHLRYPLFALDTVIKKVRAEGRLIFQTMLRGSHETRCWDRDYPFSDTEIFRDPAYPAMYFVEHSYANDYTNWWIPNSAAAEAMLRSSGLEILEHPEAETWICKPSNAVRAGEYLLDLELTGRPVNRSEENDEFMVEAVMLWNEPNNLSHWDFKIDPEWKMFAAMGKAGARAIRAVNPEVKIVLGGISPIDPNFIELLTAHGLVDECDVVAVHGFPLDWNHWKIDEWPRKIAEIRAVTGKPVWVSEAGASSFGADEVQTFGIKRTAELLLGEVERVHWYSLHDLPASWTATTRHKEAEGSAYYRHYYMGLLREDGSPKPAAECFPPGLGICQWFHFEDHRLESSVEWLRQLGVRHVRTGISWADWFRPGAEEWFDRQMNALEEFEITMTLCFTPEHLGVEPHYSSPPRSPQDFAEFAAWAVERYAPSRSGLAIDNSTSVAAAPLIDLSVGA